MKTARFFTVLLFVAILLVACATLPKATVEMSVLLEKQIDVLEDNHIKMINLYFEEKKLQAKTVVDNELHPAWLESFFAKDAVKKVWNEAINEDNEEKRMNALKRIVQAVQEEYNELLNSKIEPLETLRIECLIVIQEEYQKARRMNRSITENIASVRDIQKARNELLPHSLKNVEDILYRYLQKVDTIIDKS
jgi:hypothetical protein